MFHFLRLITIISVFLFVAFFPQSSFALTRQLPLSGQLLTPGKLAVPDGDYTMRFAIYDKDRTASDPYPSDADSTARIWTETQTVKVERGLWKVTLGSVTALPDTLNFETGNYYLGIRINTDPEMVPRKKILPVPLAVNAESVGGAKPGTGNNDILQLDSAGAINIAGNITTAGILQGANLIVGTAIQLPANSILTADIMDGTISTIDLADGLITSVKISDSSITSTKLGDGAITNAKIANDAIGTNHIIDSAVTVSKIGDGAITTIKLSDGSVSTAKLADLSVTTAKVADASITAAKLATGDLHFQNTDTGTTSLAFGLGTGTAIGTNNFSLTASNAASKPAVRYNGTSGKWQISNDGTTFADIFSGSISGITSLNGLTAGTQTFVNDTNVTITSTGSTHTLGWSGTLAVSRGGTGTGTTFTAGSVLFAGAGGVYSQDNTNFFWDSANARLGIGTASPATALQINGDVKLDTATASGSLLLGNDQDDFSSSILETGWTFTEISPPDTSDYSLTANAGHLQITVPAGSGHDCWTGVTDCARMLRSVNNTDAVYSTKIDGVNITTDAQSYGIILWQDSSNYLRFEFWTNGSVIQPKAWKVIGGVGSSAFGGAPNISLGTSNYLRVTKSGDNFYLDYSTNGSAWERSGSFTQAGFTVNQAGVHVLNANTNLATTGNFDYFHINQGGNLQVGGLANIAGILNVQNAVAFAGNLTLSKSDPSIIFNTISRTDTDFWLGVQEDGASTDNDLFQIGDGTTVGTNPFLTIDTSGNVGIGTANPSTLLELKTGTGSFPKMRFSAADVALPNYSSSSSIGDVSQTNIIGQIRNRIDGLGVQTGGLLIQGFTGNGVNDFFPLHLIGTHGGNAPTTAAVTIGGQKWNGVSNRTALSGSEIVLDIENNYGAGAGSPLLRIQGNGNIGINALTPSGNLDIRQIADGDQVIYARRNTDTSPTGNFIQFQNAAGSATLFSIDVAGALTAVGGATITCTGCITDANVADTITASNYLPLVGGTLTGNLLFSADNTYDIGASGATRPRTGYFGTSVITPALTVSSLTAGSIPFAGTGGAISQNNANFFWDSANARLGIGTATPGEKLEVVGNIKLYGNHIATVAPSATATSQTTTKISDANDVGYYTSIAIGTDGLPIISYQDFTSTDLAITKCGNASCSSGNTTTKISDADAVGYYTSIAIGTDGLPVISYRDLTLGDLAITKCGNASCSSGNTTTKISDANSVGDHTSIAIGTDSLPIISYRDATATDLAITKCGNASCSSGNTTTKISDANSVGDYTSIAIGTDSLPVISYQDLTLGDLVITKCGNASCSSGNTTTKISDANAMGQSTSIAIGTDGLPIISYQDDTLGDLAITKCGNASCSSGNTTTKISDTNFVGYSTSIAIGTDGLPIISHLDFTLLDLAITKCATASCSATSGTALTLGSNLGSSAAPFRSLYFNTLNFGKEDARVILNEQGNFFANNLFSGNTGNVGIGTTIPSGNLDIRQIADGNQVIYARRNTDTGPTGNFIQFQNAAGSATLFAVDVSGVATVGGNLIQGSGAGDDIGWSGGTLTLDAAGSRYAFDGSQTFQIDNGAGGPALKVQDAGIVTIADASGNSLLAIKDGGTSGNIGIGTASEFGSGAGVIGLANAATLPTTNPTGGGALYADAGALKWRGSSGTVTTIAAADYSEYMPAKENVEHGEIVSLSTEPNPRMDNTAPFLLEKSQKPYDNQIVGVISSYAGKEKPYGFYQPVALVGRVPVKVSLENGQIAIGDPLTSSSTPGVAMKATGAGYVIGKALESFTELPTTNYSLPTKILVFVNPGWYTPLTGPLVQGDDNEFDTINIGSLATTKDLIVTGLARIKGDLIVEGKVRGDLEVEGIVKTKGIVGGWRSYENHFLNSNFQDDFKVITSHSERSEESQEDSSASPQNDTGAVGWEYHKIKLATDSLVGSKATLDHSFNFKPADDENGATWRFMVKTAEIRRTIETQNDAEFRFGLYNDEKNYALIQNGTEPQTLKFITCVVGECATTDNIAIDSSSDNHNYIIMIKAGEMKLLIDGQEFAKHATNVPSDSILHFYEEITTNIDASQSAALDYLGVIVGRYEAF